jgi:hypothetical protein
MWALIAEHSDISEDITRFSKTTPKTRVSYSEAPTRPPAAQHISQENCEGPSEHPKTEYKTPNRRKTNTTSTNLWSQRQPNTTNEAGKITVTKNSSSRALQHRCRIAKHKNG